MTDGTVEEQLASELAPSKGPSVLPRGRQEGSPTLHDGKGRGGEDATLDPAGFERCHEKVMPVMEWFGFGKLVTVWQRFSLSSVFTSLGSSLSRGKGVGSGLGDNPGFVN